MTTGVYDLDNVGFTRRLGRDQRRVDHRLPRRRAGPRRRSPSSGWSTGSRPRSAWTRPRCAGATSCPASSRRTRPASAPPTTSATTPRRSTGRWRAAGYDDAAGRAGGAAGPPATRWPLGHRASSVYVEITAGAPGSEFGAVELLDGGRLRVRTGATPYRPGPRHDLGDDRGRPHRRRRSSDIEVVHGDTDVVRSGGLTVGLALGAARRRGHRRRPPPSWSTPPGSGPPTCSRRRSPTSCSTTAPAASTSPARRPGRVGWADLGGDGRRPLAAETDHTPMMPTFPFGAHVAVVEVDTETGHVRLRRLVAVDDAGTHPQPAAGRGPGARRHRPGRGPGAAGGGRLRRRRPAPDHQLRRLRHRLGRRSARRSSWCRWRRPRSPTSWAPRASASRAPSASIPAVYNAVVDALAHLGVRHLETPATPERIWRALRAASRIVRRPDTSPAA